MVPPIAGCAQDGGYSVQILDSEAENMGPEPVSRMDRWIDLPPDKLRRRRAVDMDHCRTLPHGFRALAGDGNELRCMLRAVQSDVALGGVFDAA